MLRSHEGGLHLCYALRRLAANIQEPYRTLSLQAIDNTIVWWKGKPAPRASALRAPWAMSPNLAKSLQSFLRQWYLRMIEHHVPCHVPSFKTIFIKHASVVDILCNHKSAIESWSLDEPPRCCCDTWSPVHVCGSQPQFGPLGPVRLLAHKSSSQMMLPSLLRAPYKIRSFPNNGNSFLSSNEELSNGANSTASHPSPSP